MYTTYHFSSIDEFNNDIIESIKTAFKTKSFTITIEEIDDNDLSDEMKTILDERINENVTDYITDEESIVILKEKYGV